MEPFRTALNLPCVHSWAFGTPAGGLDAAVGCLTELRGDEIRQLCALVSPLEDPWPPCSVSMNVGDEGECTGTFRVVRRGLDFSIATTRGSKFTLYVQLLFQHYLFIIISPGTKVNLSTLIQKALECKEALRVSEENYVNTQNDTKLSDNINNLHGNDESEEISSSQGYRDSSSDSSSSEYQDIWSSGIDSEEHD